MVSDTDVIVIVMRSPPSLNALWRNVVGVGRVKTKAYKQWCIDAGWEVKAQMAGVTRVACRYNMDIDVPISSRRDVGNWEKSIGDLCQNIGLVTNDANLFRLVVTPTDRTNCKVTITPLPTMGGIRAAPKLKLGQVRRKR